MHRQGVHKSDDRTAAGAAIALVRVKARAGDTNVDAQITTHETCRGFYQLFGLAAWLLAVQIIVAHTAGCVLSSAQAVTVASVSTLNGSPPFWTAHDWEPSRWSMMISPGTPVWVSPQSQLVTADVRQMHSGRRCAHRDTCLPACLQAMTSMLTWSQQNIARAICVILEPAAKLECY